MANPEATNGSCPDGYKHVYGKLCVSESTLERTGISDIKPPEVSDFTDFQCETVVQLIQQAYAALDAALAVPRKLLSIAKKLLGYPAELVNEAIAGALNALKGVQDGINDLLSGPGKLLAALERALDCPYIADSALGSQLGGMVDTLKEGRNLPSDQIDTLSNTVSSTASSLVDKAMESPLGKLSDISRQYDSLLKSLGIEDMFNTLAMLEECLDNICKAYRTSEKFVERLPKSTDQLASELGATYDREKKKLVSNVTDAADSTQETAKKAVDDLNGLRNTFKKS